MTGADVRIFLGRFSRAAIGLVCAGFSAFVLVLCVIAGIHFRSMVEREFYGETGNIARVLMASFDDDAATADAILTRLAAEVREGDVSPAHQAELHRLLAGDALPPSMIGPAVLDRNGTLIASAAYDQVPQVSLKDRSTFRVHAERSGGAGLYISTPMRGPLTKEWVIQFSRALRDQSGDFYGVVLLSYRLSHFVSLYEKLKLSDGGLAGLVGEDGVVRIRTLNGEIGYGSAVARMPLVYNRAIAGEKSGTFFTTGGPDNLTRIGSFMVSQTTPFYVTVAYDVDELRAQYLGYFYVLGLCWLVLSAAMAAGAALIHRMDRLGQRSQLAIINSAVAERQKITADMHDSIGASLAALLAYFTTENVDISHAKRRVGEILTELRFLVDSAEADDSDVNLLLSNVRHRMGRSIELAGISLRWQVVELPEIRGFTAHDALAVKLVLMEALSNVLHHSQAATASLSATFDPRSSIIIVSVQDDGHGFDPDDLGTGRGVPNMRRRVAGIRTGAAIFVESAPGRGTTVRIELKVPPS